MRLIVLRHGKAEPRSESGADSDRRLVDRGIRQAEFVAEALRAAGMGPDRILTSPVHRALQTARIVHQHMACAGVECPMELVAALATDQPVSGAVNAIGAHASVPTLLVVGHNPQLESLVIAATGNRIPASADVLKTGQAVVLDVETPAELLGGAECLDVLRLDGD